MPTVRRASSATEPPGGPAWRTAESCGAHARTSAPARATTAALHPRRCLTPPPPGRVPRRASVPPPSPVGNLRRAQPIVKESRPRAKAQFVAKNEGPGGAPASSPRDLRPSPKDRPVRLFGVRSPFLDARASYTALPHAQALFCGLPGRAAGNQGMPWQRGTTQIELSVRFTGGTGSPRSSMRRRMRAEVSGRATADCTPTRTRPSA